MKLLLIFYVLCVGLSGCERRNWADVGYNDGYAVGYNETCKIRATLIEGKWKNKKYAAAYRRGYSDGAIACRNRNDD